VTFESGNERKEITVTKYIHTNLKGKKEKLGIRRINVKEKEISEEDCKQTAPPPRSAKAQITIFQRNRPKSRSAALRAWF
jgi:hypothetical protein